jgi:N-acetylmuramoyl-L-alanine amidase
MRSSDKPIIIAALLVAMYASVAHAQSSNVEELYSEATSREANVRKDIESRKANEPILPLIRAARILVGTYEDIARFFPDSDRGDDALWQGGQLSAMVFWEFGEAEDRGRALQLMNQLTTNYPTSEFVAKMAPEVARLAAPLPSKAAQTKAAPSTTAARKTPPSKSSTGASAAKAPAPAVTTPVVPAPAPPLARTTPSAPAAPPSERPADRAAAPSAPVSPATPAVASVDHPATLNSIRREVQANAVRITLQLDLPVHFSDERINGPSRIFVNLQNAVSTAALDGATLSYPDDVVRQVRVGRQINGHTRVVLDLSDAGRHTVKALADPFRLVIDVERRVPVDTKSGTPSTAVTPAVPAPTAANTPQPRVAAPAPAASVVASTVRTPTPTPSTTPKAVTPPSRNTGGGLSLSRQLGLGVNRIVIDPGHGGHDPGAQIKGLNESDLVLDVALRLEKLLLRQPGTEVVLTRRTNEYVPLEERTALANRQEADLFLSIHANASDNPRARGVETYFLDFAPNAQAEAIAARENAGSARAMRSLPDIVKAIALSDKIDESRDFAAIVQASIVERMKKANRVSRNLGVKQAPFAVLIGATMPSVLAELSFMTNQQEGAWLKTQAYRQQMAEALLNGIMRYQRSLKGTQIASQ